MVEKITDKINTKLQKAEAESVKTYDSLELDKDFNEWFNNLDSVLKIAIYQAYELNKLDFEEEFNK